MTRSDDTLLDIKLTGRGDRRWKAHGGGRGTRVIHKIVRRLFQEMRVKIGHQKSRQKEIVQLSDTWKARTIEKCCLLACSLTRALLSLL